MKKFSAIAYLYRILWFTFRRTLWSCWNNSGTNTAGTIRLYYVEMKKTTGIKRTQYNLIASRQSREWGLLQYCGFSEQIFNYRPK